MIFFRFKNVIFYQTLIFFQKHFLKSLSSVSSFNTTITFISHFVLNEVEMREPNQHILPQQHHASNPTGCPRR